jgi:pimeloyl-ACP methyl ester carboxylesterase
MQTVTSSDGSKIAYDRYGDGPAVILVGGALSMRRFKKMGEIAKLLSDRYTVINYDRRGRGDSTEAGSFALEREVEDIAALIDSVGGRASVWGWSSGGALALRAAGAGIGVERIGVYEVPFMVDPEGTLPTPDYLERLQELIAAGNNAGAVKHFMRSAIRLPAPIVALMPLMPMWKGMKSTAPTLPYDWAALGAHNMRGAPLQPEEFASVTMPALVAYGSKTTPTLKKGSQALAEVLPVAELVELPKQTHNISMKVLAPVLSEFLGKVGSSHQSQAV